MPLQARFGAAARRTRRVQALFTNIRLGWYRRSFASPRRKAMSVSIHLLSPLIALIAGILILVMPRLLNYVVALYLILIGLIGLFGHQLV